MFRRLTPIGRTIRHARRELERKGWSQARPGTVWTGGPCAAGALVDAAHELKVSADKVLDTFAVANHLPFPKPDYSSTQRITVWNDTRGRTKDEVLAAFRRAEADETTPGWFG